MFTDLLTLVNIILYDVSITLDLLCFCLYAICSAALPCL